MFLSKNKNNVYPCKPQFYYIIKVAFKRGVCVGGWGGGGGGAGVNNIYACFRDGRFSIYFQL